MNVLWFIAGMVCGGSLGILIAAIMMASHNHEDCA